MYIVSLDDVSSSSGNEYTHVYGQNPDDGNFTPYIHHCFKPDVKSVILDGEMVAFDPATETIGKLQYMLKTDSSHFGLSTYILIIYASI